MARRKRASPDTASIARESVEAPREAKRRSSLDSIADEITEAPRKAKRRSSLDSIAEEIADSSKASRRVSLDSIAGEIVAARRTRRSKSPRSLASVAAEIAAPGDPTAGSPSTGDSPLDLALPARPISMELISGRGHYERVLRAVLAAKVSVWIATANVKELMVEDSRARPGRRRSMKQRDYVSVLAHLDDLAARGVELRLLHADLPSGPFRAELAQHPRLVGGGLALRRCPRVHLKAVIVDGELLYLGSANWTGAGLGAKGSGRRNFEIGFVTDDVQLLDQVQALYEQIWSGGECATCKLHDECPGPLNDLVAIRTKKRR